MWPLSSSPRVEDPERLRRFLNQLDNADWRGSSNQALEKVYSALNDLIYHEVLYYYKARKRQRTFSIATRGFSIFLGTIGVMIPLLAAADPKLFSPAAPFGYPLLAAAAAMLAVNRMFGATGGHIRYVTAQLELERNITKFRLNWLEWMSRDTMTPNNPATSTQAFKIMNEFIDNAYRVIEEETAVWGKSVSEALREYESLTANQGPAPLAPDGTALPAKRAR